jgi:hypothetical protein
MYLLRPTVRGWIASRGLDGEGGLERDVARQTFKDGRRIEKFTHLRLLNSRS